MKIAWAIVQARMDSHRFPGKVLKELSGKPVLGHVIERLKCCKKVDRILVATTQNPLDGRIVNFCERYPVPVYRGDENDVLGRYCSAVKEYGIHVAVRITADNCLIDPKIIDEMIAIHISGSYEYTCIKNLSYVAGEVIRAEALWKASRFTRKDYDREHVTPYIRDNPDAFKVKVLPEDFLGTPAGIRLTIDTPQDFEFIKRIYALFYTGDGIVDSQIVYAYVRGNLEYRL